MKNIKKENITGCMFGLAIGDALGAPIEFMNIKKIKHKFGDYGVKDFHPWGGFKRGSYTDDTQMSLSTTEGCLVSIKNGTDIITAIYREYLVWLNNQNNLFYKRAPGLSCLSALRSGVMGTLINPINNSKGSGGVMRSAPIGFFYEGEEAFEVGMKSAAITHGHVTGYLTAGFLSMLISLIVRGNSFDNSIVSCMNELEKHEGHEETKNKILEAVKLHSENVEPEIAIKQIGEGWIAEEALGIAIYCVLSFPDSYKDGVLASVNHSGDSDTTGTITGAILGTMLGEKNIPAGWINDVEDTGLIKRTAEDIYYLQ